jgi:hypothetical protein
MRLPFKQRPVRVVLAHVTPARPLINQLRALAHRHDAICLLLFVFDEWRQDGRVEVDEVGKEEGGRAIADS